MIPVHKGWATEMAQDVTYQGIQVHGGDGLRRGNRRRQHYRDARITTIYEGTTAIQANDLVGRKMAREGGVTAKALITTMRAFCAELAKSSNPHLKARTSAWSKALMPLNARANSISPTSTRTSAPAFAGSVPMVKLFGIVCGGWQLARVALAAEQRINAGSDDREFLEAKIATMRYFADTMIPEAIAAAEVIVNGSEGTLALAEAAF